jgi:hypothetical protein
MKMKILARFRPIFDFELKGKRSRAEPSRAENPSARALAQASSARTHHYYFDPKKYTHKQRIMVNQIFNSDATKFRETLNLEYFSKIAEIFSTTGQPKTSQNVKLYFSVYIQRDSYIHYTLTLNGYGVPVLSSSAALQF